MSEVDKALVEEVRAVVADAYGAWDWTDGEDMEIAGPEVVATICDVTSAVLAHLAATGRLVQP